MLDQSIFTETIHEVSEIIRTSAAPLSKEEILSYFKEMDLNEAQQNMVLEFLLTPHDEEEDAAEEADEDGDAEDTAWTEDKEAEGSSEKEEDAGKSVLPESKMFQMYLEEINSLPVYSPKKQEEMYAKLLQGDDSVIRAISDSWMLRVLEMAKELAVSSEGFEDIIQEGNMALFLKLMDLCGAGEDLDAEQELQQSVEAAMKAMILEFEGEDEDEKAMVGKVALVNEAKKYLFNENGHEATAKELSDYTQLSEDELADLLLLIEKANEKNK